MTTKTAWITGATAGFGAATVERFVAGGWQVIASGRRADKLQQLVDRHGAGRVHATAFDMRDEAAMRAAHAALPVAFAGIDLLVNNAGLALGTAPAQQADLTQWKQMIDTNVTALVTMTHMLLPQLIERRAAIVNLSSISGSYAYRGGNVYGATKAFVTQFSQNLRTDLPGSLGQTLCGHPPDHRGRHCRHHLVDREPAAALEHQPHRGDAGQPVGGGIAGRTQPDLRPAPARRSCHNAAEWDERVPAH